MTRQSTSDISSAPVVPLEELPLYSPWPARLLGLSHWEKRARSEEELYREYEVEFFAKALERARSQGPDLSFRKWFASQTDSTALQPCLTEHGIRLLSPRQQLDAFIDVVEDAIAEYLPAPALCDLGAGTGKLLHCLAERGVTTDTPVLALEYSPSARELIRHFARNDGQDIEVHSCNFLHSQITEATIPKGAVLFTSMTLVCVPLGMQEFIEKLLALQPSMVVHFEPCADLLRQDNLFHMMCQRYLAMNEYNGTTHAVVRELEAQGVLRVQDVRPHVYGSNPLLPLSVVAWKPA